MTSHDITLVYFQWIIKQDYKNRYLVTGDRSQPFEGGEGGGVGGWGGGGVLTIKLAKKKKTI